MHEAAGSTGSCGRRVIAVLATGALVLAALWIWHLCQQDNGVPFLPVRSGADWIIYPKPPETTLQRRVPMPATFRQILVLSSVPTVVNASVVAFQEGAVSINSRPVTALTTAASDWKQGRTGSVADFLRSGTNEILITVTNAMGPPALWFRMDNGQGRMLASDLTWVVSLGGAAWEPAMCAADPPAIRNGNPLFGRERVINSLQVTWPLLAALAVLALITVHIATRMGGAPVQALESGAERSNTAAWLPGTRKWIPHPILGVLVLIAVAWIALFVNNIPQFPHILGFDRDGHLQYIDFLLQHKRLPLAAEGWQMYQPPLFYVLSAMVLAPFGWETSSNSAVLLLRFFAALLSLAHLSLIYLTVRQVFPESRRKQVASLVFAGFLPINLYLAQNVTNELLSALFVTAALYFSVRIVRTPSAPPKLFIATGICLGLAMLSKFSALIAIPVVVAALAWAEMQAAPAAITVESAGRSRNRRFAWAFLRPFLLVVLPMLVVCGWHYFRVWRQYGNPFIGNWDPKLFSWWQDPGFHTAAWYQRFGAALNTPLFSSVEGFWDGLYTTLWGDSLASGSSRVAFRPPWNYDVMNLSYVLAIFPSALILIGLVRFVGALFRKPAAVPIIVCGLLAGFGLGIVGMSLKVPSYAQVKAFYALPAVLPLCLAGALGWDWIARRGRAGHFISAAGLLFWGFSAFASFWIWAGNPYVYVAQGISLADDRQYSPALKNFANALTLDPGDTLARTELAEMLLRIGQKDGARQIIKAASQQDPSSAGIYLNLGALLALEGQNQEAIAQIQAGLRIAPDHTRAYEALATCLARVGRDRDIPKVCVEGLRVLPFREELHLQLAQASAAIGDVTNCFYHAQLALLLNPEWADARAFLVSAYLAAGQPDAAIEQATEGIRRSPAAAQFYVLLANAFQAKGDRINAVQQYRLGLARQPDSVEALNNLAWLLATDRDPAVANGSEAVQLAQHACELTDHRQPVLLGTLAAAYATAGQFDNAVRTGEKARDLATAAGQEKVAARNSQLLELYRAGKPYKE